MHSRRIRVSLLCAMLIGNLGFADMTPKEALDRLMEGNKRYVSGNLEHPNRGREAREETIDEQSPFAIVVSCSDSRVAPGIIFDQGIGDLFVVRDAGNVIAATQIDSIDFAALALSSSVILVIGHTNCGAVKATLEGDIAEIPAVAKIIQPAVAQARKSKKKDLLELAIKLNAIRMRKIILESPPIAKLVKKKVLDVHAAYYNFFTGEVELLDPSTTTHLR